MHAFIHAYMHTCIHAYISTYPHIHISPYISPYITRFSEISPVGSPIFSTESRFLDQVLPCLAQLCRNHRPPPQRENLMEVVRGSWEHPDIVGDNMEYLGPIILINATKKGEILFNYEENRGFQEDTPDFFRVHQQTYDCYHPRGRATAVCLFQWECHRKWP